MTIRTKRLSLLTAQAVLAAAVCFEVFGLSVSSSDLAVRQTGGDLHVSAPRLHFITGEALNRLRDGAVVPFDFQLTVAAGSKGNVVARSLERFTISYDVWEERFSVVRLRDFRKSSLNLSTKAAETWCLDNISVPASLLPARRNLWTRLEVRSAEPKAQSATTRDAGISIATLIDIFSRSPRPQQDRWTFESPVFQLGDLTP